MTFAELERAFASKVRRKKVEEETKASFDYILADLIGRSVARVYNSSNKMPTIAEAYPTLFDKEEVEAKIQEKKAELSILRFEQFVNFHNSKFKEGGKED